MPAAKKHRRQPPKYSGELSKRIWIRPPVIGLLNHDQRENLYLAYALGVSRARFAKLPALFEHYGLDEKIAAHASMLVLFLAIDHVPGFWTASKRGAPQKRGLDFDLYAEVRLIEIQRRLSARAACNAYAKRIGAASPETVRRRYTAAKSGAAPLFARAAAFHGRAEEEHLREFLAGK
jgi:hypothetical protein